MTIRKLNDGEIVNEGDFYFYNNKPEEGATIIRNDPRSLSVFNKPYNSHITVAIFRIENVALGNMKETRRLANKLIQQKMEIDTLRSVIRQSDQTILTQQKKLIEERAKRTVYDSGTNTMKINYLAPIAKPAKL